MAGTGLGFGTFVNPMDVRIAWAKPGSLAQGAAPASR
jgi:hypothetical protein